MSVESWKYEIIDAIRSDLISVPDRDGATNISRLIDRVKSFTPISTESSEILNAVSELIREPAAEFEGESYKKYWRGLIALTKHMRTLEKNNLSSAYFEKLFSHEWEGSDLRVHALNGAVIAGRVFDPNELEKLIDIYNQHPIAWLNAAVYSSNFDMAVIYAKKALSRGSININALVLNLDGWRSVWKHDVNFGDVVNDFVATVQDNVKKNKLKNWMRIRGIKPSTSSPRAYGDILSIAIIPNEVIEHYRSMPSDYYVRERVENTENQQLEAQA